MTGREDQPFDPRRMFWPEIEDEISARYVARHGFWAAVANVMMPLAYLVATRIAGIAADPALDHDALGWWALAEVVLFVPIGIGLYRFSRAAAVAALVAFVATKLMLLSFYSGTIETGGWLIAAIWVLFYIQGIRGTFALAGYRY